MTLALRINKSNLSLGPMLASTEPGSAPHAAIDALVFIKFRREEMLMKSLEASG